MKPLLLCGTSLTLLAAISWSVAAPGQTPSAPSDQIVPNGCNTPEDLGQTEHPKLQKGIYFISEVQEGPDKIFRLQFFDPRTNQTRVLTEGGDWTGATALTYLKNWLYIMQDGKLHRVNPETGKFFPRNVEPPCDWYAGWNKPLWAYNGDLYGIKADANNGTNYRLYRLDFDRAESVAVNGAPVPFTAIPLNLPVVNSQTPNAAPNTTTVLWTEVR